jgi:hypothetical protein
VYEELSSNFKIPTEYKTYKTEAGPVITKHLLRLLQEQSGRSTAQQTPAD